MASPDCIRATSVFDGQECILGYLRAPMGQWRCAKNSHNRSSVKIFL